MSKDQLLGVLVLLGSLILIGLYGYMIYVEALRIWALIIVGTVAVAGVLGIMAWIGWVMATTPPPAPLEEAASEPVKSEEVSTPEKSKE